MRKLILLGLLVVGSNSALSFAADQPAGAKPTARPASKPSFQTTPVKRGNLSIDIDGQGSFDPIDPFDVRLRFKAYQGDLLINSIIPNGVPVKKGDVLLQIDQAVMKRTLTAAENEALAARAGYEKAKADTKIADQADALAMRQQEEGLKDAEQGVKWFQTVDGPQMLKIIDLQLAAAKNQMNDEQDELDQLKKMYKSEELTNATADIVVKRAVRQLDVSKEIYAMSKDRADKARTYSYPSVKLRVEEGLEAAHQQFALFQTSHQQAKILRQTNLAAVAAGAEAADLKLAELKQDAEKLTVRAPFDGIVGYGQVANGAWSGTDSRGLRVGEHVSAQSILMTLFQPRRLRVVLELPESKFFAIQPGQKVSVSPIAFPELKYEGMCDVVPRTVIGSGGYALSISTGDVDARLVPGMKAQLHMDVPLVDGVLLMPVSAVANSTVWVKTAHGVESRHVMTGRTDGKSIEVISGVRDGEEVLTKGKP